MGIVVSKPQLPQVLKPQRVGRISARSISVMAFCERRLTQRRVHGTSRIQLTLPPRQLRYQATDHIYAQRTTPSGIQPATVIAS